MNDDKTPDVLDEMLNDQRKDSAANKRSGLIGNLQTIALIASVLANIYFGYLKLQQSRIQSAQDRDKSLTLAINAMLEHSDHGPSFRFTSQQMLPVESGKNGQYSRVRNPQVSMSH